MFTRRFFNAILASVSFLPSDSHIVWSPGNVYFNQGAAGVTQNSTYFKTGFTGRSFALTIDISTYRNNSITQDGWGQWVVSVDESAPIPVPVPAPVTGSSLSTVVLAKNLVQGTHNIQSWFDLRDETDTYTPKDAQIVKAVLLDQGSSLQSPSGACTPLADTMMIMGDSITKGYKATDPTGASTSFNYPLATFAATLGQALHCEYGIVGESGQGWAHNSNSWNEAFPAAFSNYFVGQPRVWPSKLKFLVVAEGTNDIGDITMVVQAWLPKARMIVGNQTWIILAAPFNGSRTTQLQTAVTAYKSSSGDQRVDVVVPSSVLSMANLGAFFTVDKIHPQPLLHPLYGAILAAQIQQCTANNTSSQGYSSP